MEKVQLRGELVEAIHRIQRINMSGLFHNISKGESITLEMIYRGNKITVSDLAKCQHTSSPAVSRNLKALEEKGWIERTIDTKDRRNTYVCLTAEGVRKRNEVTKVMDSLFDGVIDKLGVEKVLEFIALNGMVYEAMNDEVKNKTEKMNA